MSRPPATGNGALERYVIPNLDNAWRTIKSMSEAPVTTHRIMSTRQVEDCVRNMAGKNGTLVAAIGITASTVRFTRERIPEMGAAVTTAAAELSGLLGYHDSSRR